jgi:hypothetical protein
MDGFVDEIERCEKTQEKVKNWYSRSKRSEFELNERLFNGWNALRRDAGFQRRNKGGWVVYRGWEDGNADILMRRRRREKRTKEVLSILVLADKQLV